MVHDIVNTHQAENYQTIIRGFINNQKQSFPVISKPLPANEDKVQAMLASLPRHKYHIALCVKGTFALKNWPKEKFAKLIDKLAVQYDAAFFIIGTPEDKEYADEVIARTTIPVANFCGRTSLLDLVAVFEKTDLFVTVDTGAMHIAATTEVPIVAIFGCTSPRRWHPLSKKAAVLSKDLECCPCSKAEDACPEHKCVDIAVDEVFYEVSKKLPINGEVIIGGINVWKRQDR
jgi:ADP-heptose:LPS heptosyltransferase